MATKTDAPVAAPPERALFRCTHRMTLPDGSTANFGDTVDATDWPWLGVRSCVNMQWLLPLNESGQRKAFPGQFRDRKPGTVPAAITVAFCGATYADNNRRALVCGRLAGHDGPHR